MVVALTDSQWESLLRPQAWSPCSANWKSEAASTSGRRETGTGCVARSRTILEPWFHARMLGEVREIFDKNRVSWSPYRTLRQVVESDPECSTENRCSRWSNNPGSGPT